MTFSSFCCLVSDYRMPCWSYSRLEFQCCFTRLRVRPGVKRSDFARMGYYSCMPSLATPAIPQDDALSRGALQSADRSLKSILFGTQYSRPIENCDSPLTYENEPRTYLRDTDGDGVSNYGEMVWGTDPTDATSKVSGLTATLIGTNLQFSWFTAPCPVYEPRASEDLVNRDTLASGSARIWTAAQKWNYPEPSMNRRVGR
jgi:hypothetical protein